MKGKIFITTYGGGHVNMVLPVIRKLKALGFDVVVLGLTTAGSVLARNDIDYIGFKDLVALSSNPERVLEVGKRLLGENNSGLVSREESIAYMGLSYDNLEQMEGVAKAAELFHQSGRQCFYPLLLMSDLLRLEKPDVVIATNSPRAEKATIDAAKKIGIPTVCLVDLFAIQEIEWIGENEYADKVCVLSEYVKDLMLSAGRDSEAVVVTGNPAFDGLIPWKEKVKQRQGIDRFEKRNILWASQPEPEMHPFTKQKGDSQLPRKIEQELFSLAEKNPSLSIVLRPHPSEELYYERLPCNIRLSENEDLYELLSQMDLVVVMSSTVGLEASLLDIPVVSVDTSVFTEDAPYSDMGVSIGVDDISALNKTILSVLHAPKSSADKSKLVLEGSATDNVVGVIIGMMK